MAGGKKKRLGTAKPAAKAGSSHRVAKASKIAAKEERRAKKLERRKKDKKAITPAQWNAPAPSHLVAKLDIPQIKSKYQSYFEFAENSEKKEKKLEFQVTDNATPPPGFVFVPIGDPALTQKCKELSREKDAMIFIVSNKGREEGSKISEHIYRTGYHFRETIVDAAIEILGETVISKPTTTPGFIEPIPETQQEIDDQADRAIKDLFPRIPNTDRQMIIDHAFKKGGMFHGEPTVGLQAEIPLSRRVQLAVLAHIRHTHTRYDKLLRETTWMNARKVVEPVCLDVLMKWRGDEETGRDQLDEILREVVVITDSEDEEDSSEDETSDEEGEVTSVSSTESPSNTNSRNQQRATIEPNPTSQPSSIDLSHSRKPNEEHAISSRTRAKTNTDSQKDKKRQRGFSRYQAAWDEARHRREDRHAASGLGYPNITAGVGVPAAHGTGTYTNNQPSIVRPVNPGYEYPREEEVRYAPAPISAVRPEQHYSHPRSPLVASMRPAEVNMRSQPERSSHYSYSQPRGATSFFVVREAPSQVVRVSPVRHNPQDMPLPSIETSSNLPSPRGDGHGNLHSSLNHQSGPYPRRVVEERVHSPLQRQVIVIDDDSPQVKRRRVVREDDIGRFRAGPVSSHDHDLYVEAPLRSDSHFAPTSSADSGNFLARPPRASQSTQGLLRHGQPVFFDPTTREELPIFDEPEQGRFVRPVYARQSNCEHVSDARPSSHGMQQPARQYADTVRRENEPPSVVQRGRILQHEPERGIGYRSPIKPSQYHGVGQNSGDPDRDLAHSFSQSRLNGSTSRTDNEFIVLSDRGNASRNHRVHYKEDIAPSTYQQVISNRARSPVRYMERPMEHRDQSRVPVARRPQNIQWQQSHNESRPVLQPQHPQHPLPPGPPVYMHPAEPRRQVIVLE